MTEYEFTKQKKLSPTHIDVTASCKE